MRNLLPPVSPWFAFGISLHQFPWVAQAVLLGGHGGRLETTSIWRKASSRPAMPRWSRRRARIIEILGDQVATAAEARQMLGLAASNA